ncbi:hypothetical protein Bca52824_024760 [Brassica carinata]|uniref:Uncharacterized protein n=1 Tax=Brassica carinata TaxID=52824 RepID=A0A8X7VK85_BRACI|nr:hypothetical protein Bca52824_024760 [Brassica carinata]
MEVVNKALVQKERGWGKNNRFSHLHLCPVSMERMKQQFGLLNLQEFQTMWELKAKDLAAKEKLSQTKLLDKLLEKTEPLSELEVALKKKLIKDMLSIKLIFCGLSAGGIIPPLRERDTDDDVSDIIPSEVEVVEISDEEEEDMKDAGKDGGGREEAEIREVQGVKVGSQARRRQSSKGDGKRRKRRS